MLYVALPDAVSSLVRLVGERWCLCSDGHRHTVNHLQRDCLCWDTDAPVNHLQRDRLCLLFGGPILTAHLEGEDISILFFIFFAGLLPPSLSLPLPFPALISETIPLYTGSN